MAGSMTAATCGTSGSLRTNYARIGHAAQELFPKILQELMTIKVPQGRLHSDVSSNGYLSRYLNATEWSIINKAQNHGYANFDIPLIYKLIRNLKTIHPPTRGWDRGYPAPTEITEGDDIERIRQTRNKILHRGNAKVSDTEFKDFFDLFKDIARRLEQYLGKPKYEFVKLFTDLETCSMDENTEKMYIERIQVLGEREIKLSEQIEKIEKECDEVQKNITTIQNSTEKIQENVGKVENKVEQIEDNVEKALDTVDKVQDNVVKVQEQIDAVQENVVIIQENVDQLQEKVEEKDYPDYLKKTVEVWIAENTSFVTTDATKDILKCLKEKHVLCVTGNSGIGKSASIQHVALILRETQAYTIYPCTHPMDIEKYYKEGHKQVFVFNDVCGKYTLLQDYVENWINREDSINNVINSDNIKILVTCRSQVFFESQFQRIKLLTQNHCNLSSDHYTLTADKMAKIAQQYLLKDDLESINKEINEYEFLPLMFTMFKKFKEKHENVDPKTFFRKPFEKYTDEMNALANSKDKCKFCALFYLVVNNGSIDEAIFEDEETQESCKTRESIFEACGINRGTPRSRIREQLESLLDFLVRKNITGKNSIVYTAIHDKMFDFLCFYFGQNQQKMFIKYVDTKEFIERTQLESIENTGTDFVILIDKKNEKHYIEKIVKDLSHGRISMYTVFFNHQMGYKVYRLKIFQCLKNLDVEILKTIISFRNECGQGPLYFACQIVHSRSTWVLNNIDHVDDEYELSQDRYKFVELFLDNGADVNETDRTDYFSPLLIACELSDRLLVMLLLDRGADVNPDEIYFAETPLLKACQSYVDRQSPEKYKIIELLLERGAGINTVNCTLVSPLSVACELGDLLLVRLLLDRGAEVNPDNIRSYQTPLVNACNSYVCEQSPDKYKIIALLLEKGASINKITDNGDSALSIACWGGKYTFIRFLIEKGAKVHPDNGNYQKHDATLIPVVCSSDTVSEDKCNIIELLLDEGADINAFVGYQDSALSIACEKGDITLIRFLIEKGAEVNLDYINLHNIDFYSYGVELSQNAKEIIELLLDKAVDVNPVDKCGDCPLSIACRKGNISLVSLLLDKGANVNHDKGDGNSPLNIACDDGNLTLVSFLLDKGADANPVDQTQIPITAACDFNCNETCQDRYDIIALLLEKGAHLEVANDKKVSPLTLACELWNINLVRFLIEKGAHVNPDYRGLKNTPLTASFRPDQLIKSYQNTSSLHQYQIVELLLQHGSNINSVNEDEDTPLTIVCRKGDIHFVKFLIERGADVNSDKKGFFKTAITAACECRYVDKEKTFQDTFKIIELLLEKLVNINTVDRWGNYALGAACDSRYHRELNLELVKFLIEKGADVNLDNHNVTETPLTTVCNFYENQLSEDRYKVVNVLLEKGANINDVNQNGDSPLTIACRRSDIQLVRFLIERGADVHSDNEYLNETPITAICKVHGNKTSHHLCIIKRLLEKGANINVVNQKGDTPLTIACRQSDLQLVRFLIENGANVNAVGKDGNSPLTIACFTGNIDVISFLIEAGAFVIPEINCLKNIPITEVSIRMLIPIVRINKSLSSFKIC